MKFWTFWKTIAAELTYQEWDKDKKKWGPLIHPKNEKQLAAAIAFNLNQLRLARKARDKLKEKAEGFDAREKDLDAREGDLDTREGDLDTREGDLDDRKGKLNSWYQRNEGRLRNAKLLEENNYHRGEYLKEFLGFIENGIALKRRVERSGVELPDNWRDDGGDESGEVMGGLAALHQKIEADPGHESRPVPSDDDELLAGM